MGWIASFFFSGGITKWLPIGLGIALAAAVAFGWWQLQRVSDRDRTIGTMTAQLDQLQQVADSNADAARRASAEADRAGRAAADLKAENAAQAARLSDIEREVSRVQPSDAQPAACPALPGPVERAVDGLRRLRAGAADHPGGSPAGAGAAGAADLPRRP